MASITPKSVGERSACRVARRLEPVVVVVASTAAAAAATVRRKPRLLQQLAQFKFALGAEGAMHAPRRQLARRVNERECHCALNGKRATRARSLGESS